MESCFIISLLLLVMNAYLSVQNVFSNLIAELTRFVICQNKAI
mgnify:CR=1 FL=1